MIITDVQARKKSMVAVYIDGEFAVNVDKEVFIISGYKVGSNIDDNEFYDLVEKSQNRRAKEKALYLIEHRDHSSKELFDKIKRTTDENSASFAVEKMKEIGLVDDEKFAKKFARELFYRKKFAARRVEYELQKKGIDKELISQIVEEMDVDPREQILSLLLGKYKSYLDDDKKLKRALLGLQRLGYDWSDIKSVLDDVKNSSD